VTWDERDHPRGPGGRFRNAVAAWRASTLKPFRERGVGAGLTQARIDAHRRGDRPEGFAAARARLLELRRGGHGTQDAAELDDLEQGFADYRRLLRAEPNGRGRAFASRDGLVNMFGEPVASALSRTQAFEVARDSQRQKRLSTSGRFGPGLRAEGHGADAARLHAGGKRTHARARQEAARVPQRRTPGWARTVSDRIADQRGLPR
jgi:hypothetical protein